MALAKVELKNKRQISRVICVERTGLYASHINLSLTEKAIMPKKFEQ